jgi:hypothetical protein
LQEKIQPDILADQDCVQHGAFPDKGDIRQEGKTDTSRHD